MQGRRMNELIHKLGLTVLIAPTLWCVIFIVNHLYKSKQISKRYKDLKYRGYSDDMSYDMVLEEFKDQYKFGENEFWGITLLVVFFQAFDEDAPKWVCFVITLIALAIFVWRGRKEK
jgi:hypothetical protein